MEEKLALEKTYNQNRAVPWLMYPKPITFLYLLFIHANMDFSNQQALPPEPEQEAASEMQKLFDTEEQDSLEDISEKHEREHVFHSLQEEKTIDDLSETEDADPSKKQENDSGPDYSMALDYNSKAAEERDYRIIQHRTMESLSMMSSAGYHDDRPGYVH